MDDIYINRISGLNKYQVNQKNRLCYITYIITQLINKFSSYITSLIY